MKNNYELKISIGNFENDSGILVELFNTSSQTPEDSFLLSKKDILLGLRKAETRNQEINALRDEFKTFLETSSDEEEIKTKWKSFQESCKSLFETK